MSSELPVLKASDFASDQDIRWCPGCGDYSILAQMKKMLPDLGLPQEQIVFISGIGCSSRFPYYMNTYGMHSIHGRAPAFATGLRVTRPDLKVFVITGDGDSLSIGGNHFIHMLRRNVDVTMVLFNNRIYGLTKGQYSPTSPEGQVTKSTPMGSVDHPLNPISVALGAEAGFIARSVDSNIKHLAATLYRAAQHRGTSLVEVYQNCNVFNDGAFSYAQDKATRADTTLELEHGKPMIFGKNRDKGVRLNGLRPEVVDLSTGISHDDLLFHDEQADTALVHILAKMRHPEMPEPIGVFRDVEKGIFEDQVRGQLNTAVEKKGAGDLVKLFASGETWDVE
ncbi:2-oxoacid:ferredoxin oxidoreductase subunit beta [Aureliella helgolandensis]|uniref:2-oxoglutarate oxidoreductase subunit KorB n=1 Tax=Aureliella helgolandensis TaxID=2527968 RepID=A0A518GC67_9BACT|nr:2-oxoacid:ferredoxin oxidoreductase subunit beta [Aureliella helgolandensis]QDV26194.1 2-oxoglutarate oxidoreductase subunit KorB [Aureliella helgolandensis]